MDVSVEWRGSLPVPVFKDKATYVDSETKEHDRVAMKYLSYALYPLVAAYAVYTLVYERHKSWYGVVEVVLFVTSTCCPGTRGCYPRWWVQSTRLALS